MARMGEAGLTPRRPALQHRIKDDVADGVVPNDSACSNTTTAAVVAELVKRVIAQRPEPGEVASGDAEMVANFGPKIPLHPRQSLESSGGWPAKYPERLSPALR